ncbi:substrate-binding periplasmic protein [Pseudoalteromonas tunicata]|uniref:substrate-binding periplasmic protein n=1 Tax=Pseudoalteromonas tunicata TaxID=314281 RepID=UPI00273E0CA2|nr:transporter substrate-binding domain-containing protein [Pseudoalteromonas tunicata]MDP4983678.1 transporter substrate-binding domain-containing protein [Pseudoalteromonas tunicata]
MVARIFYVFLILVSNQIAAKCLLTFAAPDDVEILYKEIQLLHQAYQAIGCDFTVLTMPAGRAIIEDIRDDSIDGEVVRGRNFSNLVTDFIAIPTPIMTMEVFAFSKTKKIEYATWNALKPYRIATVRGFTVIEKQLQKHQQITLLNTATQAFELLEKDRVDIVILPAPLRQLATFNIETLQPALLEQPLYHFLHKRHQHLITPLNLEIQQLLTESKVDPK